MIPPIFYDFVLAQVFTCFMDPSAWTVGAIPPYTLLLTLLKTWITYFISITCRRYNW